MAGQITYIRHYQRGLVKSTLTSDVPLKRGEWDQMVMEKLGDGWERIPAVTAMHPKTRIKTTGQLK